ncbi:MAG: hypothetical protein ACRD03_12220 [Acidimicrobiales bacterium]
MTAALSVALLGACNGDGTASPTTTTTTQAKSNTTTSLVDPAGEAVLQGYRTYWDAYLRSADPMDPENTLLVEHASGPALEAVQKAFLALKSAGKVIRGDLDLAPRVVTVATDTATVRDCYGDATGVFDAVTGARQDQPSGQRHLVTATLRLVTGTWKVERLADEGLGCTAA